MKGNILIVDVKPDSLSVLEEILVADGHSVRAAVNGDAALKELSASLPDLIFLGAMMPGMDGFDLLKSLKGDPATSSIPLLFISTGDDTEDKIRAFDAGGVDSITRPFTGMEVLARVQTHLTLSKTRQELQRVKSELAMEMKARIGAEERMRAREDMYSAIFANIGIGVSLISQEMEILLLNSVMQRWFPHIELSKRPICYKSFNVPPHDEICTYCPTVHTLRDGKVHAAVTDTPTEGGLRHFRITSSPLYSGDGAVSAAIEVVEDITEQKRAEDDIFRMNVYNRSLIEASLDPLVTIGPDGLITDANSATEEVTGCKWSELIGSDFSDYFTDPYSARSGYQKAFRDGYVRDYPLEIRHRDGRVTPVLYNASVLRDMDEKVIGVFAAARDITEQKRAEENRKKLEMQLQQAQKMESIGLLAGGIAHDFNNILTAIIGYSDLIRKSDTDSSLLHHAEQVYASANRAAELINGLLTFSRKRALQMMPLDLCGVVRGIEKMLERLVPEDIALRTTIFHKELIVMADKGQIEQVLMNMVTNAKDAMPKGGALSIDVFPAMMGESFIHDHGFADPGRYACISLTDTGIGMDEETRKRIFEPFFTTKEVGKGTGLGMSIVYGIVKQHNGHISVCSEKGKGTTFKIYLPFIAEEVTEARDAGNAAAPPGGTETILLAEDDAAVRELHRMILEMAGYRVIEAVNGRDALGKFIEHRMEIDMLATDVIMPEMNGKALYDEIKKIHPDMRILFMSGYTRDFMMERGIMEEEFSIVAKPVTPQELLKRIRETLDSKRFQ